MKLLQGLRCGAEHPPPPSPLQATARGSELAIATATVGPPELTSDSREQNPSHDHDDPLHDCPPLASPA